MQKTVHYLLDPQSGWRLRTISMIVFGATGVGWGAAALGVWFWNGQMARQQTIIQPPEVLYQSVSFSGRKIASVFPKVKVEPEFIRPAKENIGPSSFWSVMMRWDAQEREPSLAVKVRQVCSLNPQGPRCRSLKANLVTGVRKDLKGASVALFDCDLNDSQIPNPSLNNTCGRNRKKQPAQAGSEAFAQLEKACFEKQALSCQTMGASFYLKGDDKSAESFFGQACSLGLEKGCFALAELYQRQNRLTKAHPMFSKLCKTAQRWRGWACYALATLELEFKNRQMTKQALRLSCNSYEPAGCYLLAQLLVEGPKVVEKEVYRVMNQGCFRQNSVFGFNPLPCWQLLEWQQTKMRGIGVLRTVQFMLARGGYSRPGHNRKIVEEQPKNMAPLVAMMNQDLRLKRHESCTRAFFALKAFGASLGGVSQAHDQCQWQRQRQIKAAKEDRYLGIFAKYVLIR